MTVWFTSDPHFGHEFVARTRGHESASGHDMEIIDSWHATVRKDDQVWVLGDLAMSNPARALSVIATLPGVKHLIAGNHDRCHPMHRDSHKRQAEFLSAFASVQTFARRRFDGSEALLSHFPYAGDHGEDRYTNYRLRDQGVPIVHGHTHSSEINTVSSVGTRQLHVGWDAWRRLVPLDELSALVRR